MTAPSRPLLLAALALVLAGAGYTFYWFHVAAGLRKEISAWAEERRAAGWTVETGEIAVGGFPLALRARIPAPLLAAPDGTSWRAEALTADASPFDLTRVALAAPGRHVLDWAGHGIAAEAGRFDLYLDFTDGRLERARLEAADLKADPPGLEGLEVAALAGGLDLSAHQGEGPQQASAVFSLALRGVRLPEFPGMPFDRRVEAAAVEGRVMGALPPGAAADSLAQWSRAGGTVEIDRLALDWAPLALEGEGTFAFDPAMQPLLALSARVRGYSELMDRLAQAGVVDAATANLAKMLLGLMSKPDTQGRQAVPVPVTLQDGDLYLGPARVARVPPLAW